MNISIIVPLVDDHSENLTHCMIRVLDAAVAVRVMGACRILAHVLQLVDDVRQVGA